MLKELWLAVLLAALASGAVLDDHLPVEHRGADGGGIPLGPEIPEPAADPAGPAGDALLAIEADIESELETQLRDSLPPAVPFRTVPYRPVYGYGWSPYPVPYLLAAAGRPLGPPPAPWYLSAPAAAARGQPLLRLSPGLTAADQPAPSVAASRIYDVTISSAHPPQLIE